MFSLREDSQVVTQCYSDDVNNNVIILVVCVWWCIDSAASVGSE